MVSHLTMSDHTMFDKLSMSDIKSAFSTITCPFIDGINQLIFLQYKGDSI